jgi:hypothetical protein
MVSHSSERSHQALPHSISSIGKEVLLPCYVETFGGGVVEHAGIVGAPFPACKKKTKLKVEVYCRKNVLGYDIFTAPPWALVSHRDCCWDENAIESSKAVFERLVFRIFGYLVG